jgi:hypothetical protein
VDPGTVSLIERPFQEVVDDLLTAIIGGVINERIVFDVGQDLYPLSEPASAIRSITGQRVPPGATEPVHYAFQPGIDFEFDEGRNAVAWLRGGAKPDDGSTFAVDYLRPGQPSPITDINVGSVTRVLAEALGREIATVYQQINQAYLAAFIDTASGTSLDLVVAILDVARKRGDAAVGLVTFFRAAGADGAITISEGIELRTKKGTATFETEEPRTMQRGQARIDVPVRAAKGFEGDKGKVAAGEIAEVAQLIAGIDHITNLEPTALGAEDESDEDLRLRAKATLRGLGKGTLAALANAVFDEDGTLIEAWDPASAAKPSPVGTATLLVEREPEGFPGLQARVNETRAAGILVTVLARYVFFKPRLVVTSPSAQTAAAADKVVAKIISAMQSYVDSLEAMAPAKGSDLKSALQQVEGVKDVRFADIIAFRSDVVRPGTDMLVEALLSAVSAAAGGLDAMRSSFQRIVTAEAPQAPTGARIPDRSLVQGPSGQRATDAEIESGQFSVVTPAADGTWWVYLDAEPADIVVTTGT